jgi:hypothetical protein
MLLFPHLSVAVKVTVGSAAESIAAAAQAR